jgi:hypothetical protein
MKDHCCCATAAAAAGEPIQLRAHGIVVQFERDMRIKSRATAARCLLDVFAAPREFLLIA